METLNPSTSLDITGRSWRGASPPRRILAIRLQAMGDLVITLPYLNHLRGLLPADAGLDLLTREEVASIPRSMVLFDEVYALGGGRDLKKQLFSSLFFLPRLLKNRYELIIDLQNNTVSRFIRKMLFPPAWTAFDRFAPLPAGERTRQTITAAGLGESSLRMDFQLRDRDGALRLLIENGWSPADELVMLNPAGAFETRNWDIRNYAGFARIWLGEFPHTKFLVMGLDRIAGKAMRLKEQLGDRLIDLTGKTTPATAFAIIQQAAFVLSEDSGLMHFAWVSGIPTLALLGSTRSDWSRPLGTHSLCLDSSDLPCGNCMLEKCRYGDNHCLSRLTPERVFEKAMTLMKKTVWL